MTSREAMYDEIQTLRAKLKEAEEEIELVVEQRELIVLHAEEVIADRDSLQAKLKEAEALAQTRTDEAVTLARLLDRQTRALERLQRATAEWAASERAPVAVAQALHEGRAALGDSATEKFDPDLTLEEEIGPWPEDSPTAAAQQEAVERRAEPLEDSATARCPGCGDVWNLDAGESGCDHPFHAGPDAEDSPTEDGLSGVVDPEARDPLDPSRPVVRRGEGRGMTSPEATGNPAESVQSEDSAREEE